VNQEFIPMGLMLSSLYPTCGEIELLHDLKKVNIVTVCDSRSPMSAFFHAVWMLF